MVNKSRRSLGTEHAIGAGSSFISLDNFWIIWRAYTAVVRVIGIHFRTTSLSPGVHRREVLEAGIGVLGFSGLSGCTGDRSPDPSGGTEPQPTPTETVASESTASETTVASPTPTPTETPVPLPETCEPLPDIDGLPTPPSELTEDSVETFVREFERVYAVATNDDYGGVDSLDIHSVERVGEQYIVSLRFEAVPVMPTADADGTTPTPPPLDALTHRAVYRLTDERMLRELRSHIDGALFSHTCWTLERG